MMAFYQNPLVFQLKRGELIYNKTGEVLREKIQLRKQLTNAFKFKNLEYFAQTFSSAILHMI